jgi:NAD(P)-dependent dehydrogenase (short-subunit alcohol dehydrogenase family)
MMKNGHNDERPMTPASALIVGAGPGLSAALARAFAKAGMKVALAARTPDDLGPLARAIGARTFACNVAHPEQVETLFRDLDATAGTPDVVVFNASYRARGPFVDLDHNEVQRALMVTAYGGFLVAQEAARRMRAQGHGAIFFTGASASVKGYPQSAPFAMAKFALRGLAQSMARELSPQGIHVAHFVIDGAIRSEKRAQDTEHPDSMLDPDAIAATYLHILGQPRSAWTWEVELRPWVERF